MKAIRSYRPLFPTQRFKLIGIGLRFGLGLGIAWVFELGLLIGSAPLDKLVGVSTTQA